MNAEETARLFHDTYEMLAPLHGYNTRQDTAVFDIDSSNGKLMIATAEIVAKVIRDAAIDECAVACDIQINPDEGITDDWKGGVCQCLIAVERLKTDKEQT